MKRILPLLPLLFVCPLLRAQVSNPSIVPVPTTPSSCATLPLQVVQNTNQLYGTNGSGGCSQIGSGGGGGSSVTLENVYAAPGSFTFAHNLNSLFPQVTCYTRVGAGYGSAACTPVPVDANDTLVSVPAAGDYIVAFTSGGTLAADFQIATAPSPLLYEPTMSGTQTTPVFTDTQTALNGYSGTVTYSASGLPSGITANAFSPTTITGSGTNTFTLSFPATQTPATSSFTVQGTDGTKTHTTSPSITVGNINQGLVECWPMTDGSGTTFADGCGTGNTQTVATGTLTWASHSGLPGTTPSFSSTAYTVGSNNTATNFNGSTPFSAGAWINPSSTAGGAQIILATADPANNNIGWEFYLGYQTSTTYQVSTLFTNTYPTNALSVATGGSLFTNGTLHFVSFTYDGSKTAAGVILYVDGVAQPPSVIFNVLTGSIANTKNLAIGASTAGAAPIGPAVIAYVRIWNRVLSATDEANYYAAGPR